MHIFAALVAGALFGAGLTVAQMLDPRKITDFLDVAGISRGTWDPTLLMVFAGALTTMWVAYVLQRRMARPILGGAFLVPRPGLVDRRLLAGSALFGIGWGLAGICPGPALTAVGLADREIGDVLAFVAAMIAGVVLSWAFVPGVPDAAAGGKASDPG